MGGEFRKFEAELGKFKGDFEKLILFKTLGFLSQRLPNHLVPQNPKIQQAHLLGKLQQFYQELDDTKNSKKGYVKIGIFPMLGTEFFTKMISEFHKQYPEIRVRFVEDGASNLKKALLQGELDLVVMPFPIDEELFDFLPFLN